MFRQIVSMLLKNEVAELKRRSAGGVMILLSVTLLGLAMVPYFERAEIEAGPAGIPFAGVVILTMLAAAAFDPRLIWDAGEPDRD